MPLIVQNKRLFWQIELYNASTAREYGKDSGTEHGQGMRVLGRTTGRLTLFFLSSQHDRAEETDIIPIRELCNKKILLLYASACAGAHSVQDDKTRPCAGATGTQRYTTTVYVNYMMER